MCGDVVTCPSNFREVNKAFPLWHAFNGTLTSGVVQIENVISDGGRSEWTCKDRRINDSKLLAITVTGVFACPLQPRMLIKVKSL